MSSISRVIREYARSAQTPCTVTEHKSIVPLLQNAAEIIAQTEFYIGLQKLDVIGISAYQRKVNKLKGGIGK